MPLRSGWVSSLRSLPSLSFCSRQHHEVDAGIVPFVVRRLLIAELGLAGIDIAAPDGHRPFVVAGTHGLVPRRRIAGAVIDQVGARIIGIPAPIGAAADLPGVAFPGRRAEALLAVVRIGLVEVVAEQHVLVRAGRIGAPFLLAGPHVIGGHIAAHAELGAGGADEHLVLDDVRRDRQRRADLDSRSSRSSRLPRRSWRSARRHGRRAGS